MTRHAPYYRIGSLYRIRLNLKMLVILASTSQDFDVLKAGFGPWPTQTSNNKTHHHHRIGLPFSAVAHNSITCTPQVTTQLHALLKSKPQMGQEAAALHLTQATPCLQALPIWPTKVQFRISDTLHSSSIHQPFINHSSTYSSTSHQLHFLRQTHIPHIIRLISRRILLEIRLSARFP